MSADSQLPPASAFDELAARFEAYEDAVRSAHRMLSDPAGLHLTPDGAREAALGELDDAMGGQGPLPAHWLTRERPDLTPSPGQWQSAWERLAPSHEHYVTHVSSRGMAASLSSSVYLDLLCRARSARRVLDLGSGYSSLVLRRYAEQAEHPVEVVSVDDDLAWLGRTADLLEGQGLASTGLVTWELFQQVDWEPFDVVMHDLAMGEVREAGMPVAARCLAPGGVLLLDDAQALSHRRHMTRTAQDAGLTLYSLRRWTLDEFGRWATLAVGPEAGGPV